MPRASFAVALVGLRLEERLGVPGLYADDRHTPLGQPAEQPLRQRSSLEADLIERRGRVQENGRQIVGMTRHLQLTDDPPALVEHAH